MGDCQMALTLLVCDPELNQLHSDSQGSRWQFRKPDNRGPADEAPSAMCPPMHRFTTRLFAMACNTIHENGNCNAQRKETRSDFSFAFLFSVVLLHGIVFPFILCQPALAQLEANEAPIIRLKGKVLLPTGVDPRSLTMELVEPVPPRLFEFKTIPIKLHEDATFETSTQGMSYRTVITVRSLDGQWKGFWSSTIHDLLSNSKDPILLKLSAPVLQKIQVTYDSRPVAGAHVFVSDAFYPEPIQSDQDGLVSVGRLELHQPVFLAAVANGNLVASVVYESLPKNGTPFQLKLKEWELAPIQIVGTDGKPMANVAISYGSIGSEKLSNNADLKSLTARSDENGMTEPILFSDLRYAFDVLSPDLRFVSFQRTTTPFQVVVAPLQPNVEVRGKLTLPEGIEDGLLLSGCSFQNEVPHMSSNFQCRVKQDGSFVASVHPEYTYCVYLEDADWVSAPWTGILASSKPELVEPLTLDVVEGEAVEVLVTRGKELAPAAGVWVHFSQPHSFTWIEDGETKNGSTGRRWWAYSDEDGIITTRARVGKIESYVSDGSWKAETKGSVLPGETTVLSFHHDVQEPIAFEGRLKMANDVEPGIPWSQVSVDLYLYKVYRSGAEVAVDDQGVFRGRAASPRIAVLARSRDGKYCGVQVVDLEASVVEPLVIQLNPSVTVNGRMVDPDGFAFPNAKIELDTRPLIRWAKEKPLGGTTFHTENFNATTDLSGRYEFKSACSGVPMAMFAHAFDNSRTTTILYENELRPPLAHLPTVVLTEQDLTSMPLQKRMANRVDSSRLLNTNTVLVYNGTEKSALEMSKGLFGRAAAGATKHLSPLFVSDSTLKSDPANSAWLKEQGWGLSHDHELLIVLLDQTGKPIVTRRVDANENITLINEVIDPKQIQLVDQSWDAQTRFDQALELAGRTGRDVWISFMSIRNPASIAFLRWQQEHGQELEKHFVLLRIDWIRDERIDAILDRYSIARDSANQLIGVLVNHEGVLLQDTTGEAQYKQIEPFQFVDRERIGDLMKATSKPINPAQWEKWLESL